MPSPKIPRRVPPKRTTRKSKSPSAPTRSGAQATPEQLELALLAFMEQFASLAMAAGVTAPAMQVITNRAFIASASSRARLRNARINNSAVAAMTGLNRAEVKNILNIPPLEQFSKLKSRQGIDRLVDVWRTSPDFTDRSSRPRQLMRKSGPTTFPDLVRRHGGDIPPAAALRELKRRRLVEVCAESVRLLPQDSRAVTTENAKTLAAALQALLEAAVGTSDSRVRAQHSGTKITLSHPLAAKLLKRHLDTAIPMFLASARTAAEGIAAPRKSNSSGTVQIEIVAVMPA
jgi:hypothetical protein